MKRSGKQFFIDTVIVCVGLMCLLDTAGAQTPSEFSTDEMLEYTLDSIRSKMDSALDQNKDLSAKNASIRQRILSFKKELRGFDDDLIRLRQETIDLKNDIKLQAQELKIQEKHLNNILERKKHMLFERDSLKTQIETIQTERGLLTQNVEDTRFDIQEVQGSLKGPTDSTLLNYYSEEKLKFLEMIKDYAQRIAEKQDRLDRMELGIADQLREKEAALREQESMKRMAEDFEFQLKEEQASTALLRRAARKCQNDMESARQLVREENQQKREYIKQLKTTMQDMEAAAAGVAGRFSIDEKEMRRYLALLEEENELLFAHRQLLEDQALLQQRKDDQDHTILVMSDQYGQKQEERDRLQKEKVDSQNAIVNQRQKNESLKRDQERIRKINDQLAQDVEAVKLKVARVREDAFGKKRDELLKAIKEQGERNLVLNQEMAAAKSADAEGQNQLKDARQIAARLLEEIRILNEAGPALKEQEKELAAQQENLSTLVETRLADLKNQIKQGQMRKKALGASVEVVNKKYQRGQEQSGDFEAERVELMRYLDVLRMENEALQKKLKSLQGSSS